MKNTIRKVVLIGFSFFLIFNIFEPVSAAFERRITTYYNEVGPYYNVDVTDNEVLTEPIETPEITVVPEVSEAPPIVDNTIEFSEEELETNKILEENFEYEESKDARTSIYGNKEIPELKQVIFSSIDINYLNNDKYEPIDTRIIEKEHSTRSASNYI